MKVSDLVFKNHPLGFDGTVATHTFSNGYGASIITGEHAYSNEDAPYELAVYFITMRLPMTQNSQVMCWAASLKMK